MGKHKKKPFIDKKNSVTFHLVRRSQRDVSGFIDYESQEAANDGSDSAIPSDFVLMPAYTNSEKYSKVIVPDAAPSAQKNKDKIDVGEKTEWDQSSNLYKLKETFEQAGDTLVDDTYLKFTKPITGEGTFIPAPGVNNEGDAHHDDLLLEDPAIREVERTYESITLNPDLMDPEIAEALFGDWGDDNEEGGAGGGNGNPFEELLDDFVLTASEEPSCIELSQDERNPISSELAFDYDAHIRDLMDRARRAQEGHGVPINKCPAHEKAKEDMEFFAKAKALNTLSENAVDEYDAQIDEDDDSFANVPSDDDNSQSARGSRREHLEVPAGVAPALPPEAEEKLLQKFEATLAEYDTSDDEDGEGYDDFDTHGNSLFPSHGDAGSSTAVMTNMPDAIGQVEQDNHDGESIARGGDSRPGGDFGTVSSMVTTDEEARYNLREISEQQLDSVLDAYLKEKSDRELAEGVVKAKEKRCGGSGHYALMNVKPTEQREDKRRDDDDDDERENDDGIQFLPDMVDELEPPAEDVLIDGKSYFSIKQQSPWDCESVLTTYSNLDNNPAIIDRPGRGRTKKNKNKKMTTTDEGPLDDNDFSNVQQIRLSNKTGLPLDMKNAEDEIDPSSVVEGASVWTTGTNKGQARRRGETPEEKKARKAAIKAEKQDRRLQKKVLKEVFSEEFRKRAGDTESNDVAGLSVFKY